MKVLRLAHLRKDCGTCKGIGATVMQTMIGNNARGRCDMRTAWQGGRTTPVGLLLDTVSHPHRCGKLSLRRARFGVRVR